MAANFLTQRRNQFANLLGRAAVAPKEDKAERIGRTKEAALLRAQLLAGAAENDRAGRSFLQTAHLSGQ